MIRASLRARADQGRREDAAVEVRRTRARLAGIAADADRFLGVPAGTTIATLEERLGAAPTLPALSRETARLLRRVSLRCTPRPEEEVPA